MTVSLIISTSSIISLVGLALSIVLRASLSQLYDYLNHRNVARSNVIELFDYRSAREHVLG